MSSSTYNRQQLYRLTNQILNTNSLHFITISLLFLPFTVTAVNLFASSSTSFDPFNLFFINPRTFSSQNLLTLLTYIFFVIPPTVAGISLITYTTNQYIHHQPVTFSSTLKSLKHSYIPLLHTLTSGSIILIIIFLLFTLSPLAITETVKSLGFHFDPLLSTFISSIFSYASAICMVFYVTVWGSASPITVLESKSGFESLRQSASQSSEFRNHSFSIVFITGFGIGMCFSYASVLEKSGTTSYWMIWILQVGVVHLNPLMLILVYVVGNTVLYVQCKVASGEEVSKTSVDVFREWVKEPVNGGFSYLLYLSVIVWSILLCWQFYCIFMLMNKYK